MNIEEAIKYIKNDIECDKDTRDWFNDKNNTTRKQIEESIDAYETLLTAYEKEKEANKKLDKEAQGYLEELIGDGSMNIRRIQELEAELEKEKEKNKFLNWYFENQKDNFVHKDKIKAKIEEFKIVRDTILENEKELNRPMMTYDLKRNDYCEKMLQSLLEKE